MAIKVINVPLECALDTPYRDHVCVMGNLDGVHKGHQALIEDARKLATDLGKPLGAITFDPHPRQAFSPDTTPFLLTTKDQKTELLESLGIETLFVLPFNRRLSMLSPEEFVFDILGKTIGLAGVVIGEEFCFGRKRSGTAKTLQELGSQKNIRVHVTTPVLIAGENEKYSSSTVREALLAGDPQRASDILGRPWQIEGIVQKGQQLGRTIDFPTANISLGEYSHPAKGVYAVEVEIDGTIQKGVANFGNRPTVDGQNILLEVFIFDFNRDIYGEVIRVNFIHFIRPEQKFDGLDALKAQIEVDSETAKRLLS